MDQTETELTVGAGKKKSRAPVETRKLLLAVRTDKSVGPSNFFILRSKVGFLEREGERERTEFRIFIPKAKEKEEKRTANEGEGT